ncbi:jg15673 [Pararge aegeria aegeria]|uniref:Jg15673 protein n=1 Tax=Pararge aegeria aegeria TaxID=348720 RepID=A0A8S4S590_9NEOP|nr:jg15673 [Pararge aegeria aegeria]
MKGWVISQDHDDCAAIAQSFIDRLSLTPYSQLGQGQLDVSSSDSQIPVRSCMEVDDIAAAGVGTGLFDTAVIPTRGRDVADQITVAGITNLVSIEPAHSVGIDYADLIDIVEFAADIYFAEFVEYSSSFSTVSENLTLFVRVFEFVDLYNQVVALIADFVH